jgi:hypothetical protein
VIRPKYGWREFTGNIEKSFDREDGDTLDMFREWQAALHLRLEAGAEEYGDTSYKRSFTELLDELQQENLDRAGWAYIIWVKASAIADKSDISPDSRAFFEHIRDASLSVAHRSFGAYMQDLTSLFRVAITECLPDAD